MLSNAASYLRVLKLFSFDLGKKEFKDITREKVLEFLDKRKKSIDVSLKIQGILDSAIGALFH